MYRMHYLIIYVYVFLFILPSPIIYNPVLVGNVSIHLFFVLFCYANILSLQLKMARSISFRLTNQITVSMLHAVHVYLPTVVEVPVGIQLQLLHLLHLIQHLMHIELGHEELQTTVSVSLTANQRGA